MIRTACQPDQIASLYHACLHMWRTPTVAKELVKSSYFIPVRRSHKLSIHCEHTQVTKRSIASRNEKRLSLTHIQASISFEHSLSKLVPINYPQEQ